MGDQASGKLSPFLRQRRIAAAAPFLAGRVLDYGCGAGALADHIGPELYAGVETDVESLNRARREHPRHRFYHPVEFDGHGRAFDTIALLAVIEHIEDRAGFLRDLVRFLAPGGRVVLTTPHPLAGPIHGAGAKAGLFSREAGEEHGSLVGKKGMMRLAAEAGFIVTARRRFLLGLNQLFILEQS